jgi:uncharacterized protein (DUF4415 family)
MKTGAMHEQLDPPRQPWETVVYTDDPDLPDVEYLKPVKDFLPRPEELVVKNPTRKVTIALDQASIDFFKAEARRLNVSYQRMIRILLQEYVARVQHQHVDPPS